MRYMLEFIPAWLMAQVLRWSPRPVARAIAMGFASAVLTLHGRLRRTGLRNLELAYPDMPRKERERILRELFRSLGRLLADVPKFPTWTRKNVVQFAQYDGLEHYLTAADRGRGVLLLTGHIGGWEVGSFFHSLMGHTMHIVVRDLDNPYLDRYTRHLRCLHGNQTHDKDTFARGLLAAMKKGETVGVLMDTNMTPPQGVFVNFFGIPACTASGVARVAQHTGAAVVPAFTVWDEKLGRYRVCFEPALPTVNTGDAEADAITNTQTYTTALENIIRRYPEQWLWVHRRWKTRPNGESGLYC
jgi:KDO2-lipid IV(A) lauroyltransferase